MNRRIRSLRYIVLALALFTYVNTETLHSVPAVAGMQRQSASPGRVSGSITQNLPSKAPKQLIENPSHVRQRGSVQHIVAGDTKYASPANS